jgi:hypothetical protein
MFTGFAIELIHALLALVVFDDAKIDEYFVVLIWRRIESCRSNIKNLYHFSTRESLAFFLIFDGVRSRKPGTLTL